MNSEIFRQYTDPETFEKIVDYPNVTAMWNHSVATYPDTVAVTDNGKSYTYAQLDAEVAAFRAVLGDHGITPGSLVGILCPNSAEFVKAFLACATYGVPTVLMPAHLDEKTVYGMSAMFGMKAVIYHESLTDKVSVIGNAALGGAAIAAMVPLLWEHFLKEYQKKYPPYHST